MVGWILIEDTNIDYPVMQTPADPNYYLKHDFEKNYTDYGCPFMQADCDALCPSDNLIIYGHNMKDGSMFNSLHSYSDQAYYDAHPVMYLNTPKQNYKIEIFSAYICSYDSDTYTLSFASAEEYAAWVAKMKSQSTFTSDTEVTVDDRVITLSTCTYEYDNARFVVQGKLVPLAG